MKKIYNKPVIDVESFVTENIMETWNATNILSYNETTGDGANYNLGTSYIKFQNDPNNVLQGIDYSNFGL